MSVSLFDLNTLRGRSKPTARIIAVGGGKGGIGKSFFSSSLAICLAQLGFKTLAIDLDLGAANLHTWLGLPINPKGVNEFIHSSDMSLKDVISETQWRNLSLISGSSEALDMANINELQRSRLMSAIYREPADFIILDLSAGTHHTTLDFFLMAQSKLVVFTPEPSSIENAYRFLKYAFYRKLRRYEHQLQLKDQIDSLTTDKGLKAIKSPAELIRALVKRDPTMGAKLDQLMSEMNFKIVLNQARLRSELDIGFSLQSVCTKYFGFPCQFVGGLEYDNAVWQCLKQRQHLLLANRQTHLYAQMMAIARALSSNQAQKAAV